MAKSEQKPNRQHIAAVLLFRFLLMLLELEIDNGFHKALLASLYIIMSI